MRTFGKFQTLRDLRKSLKKSFVPEVHKIQYEDWMSNSEEIIHKLKVKFHNTVAVRSNAKSEDHLGASGAGAYTSVLDVSITSTSELKSAINIVFESYKKNCSSLSGESILIQDMVKNTLLSGVVFTRCIDDGAPYYVISYDDETGSTESVTAGFIIPKTIMVHHDAVSTHFVSKRLDKIVQSVREIEHVLSHPYLDVEFAITKDGTVNILQARPITTFTKWQTGFEEPSSQKLRELSKTIYEYSNRRHGILGERTILANMPDWNPAELLGTQPSQLALSLFQYFIGDENWRLARADLGYKSLPEVGLIIQLLNQPYVDVRLSLNSLLPKKLNANTSEKYINHVLDMFNAFPSKHDKFEFELAITSFDFCLSDRLTSEFNTSLNLNEQSQVLDAYLDLTKNIVGVAADSSLVRTAAEVENVIQKVDLSSIQTDSEIIFLDKIKMGIATCKKMGRLFAVQARHAFIAEGFLRSLENLNILSAYRLEEFRNSISSIGKKMSLDTMKLSNGEISNEAFMAIYGHLRPATFDITSPTYRERDAIIGTSTKEIVKHSVTNFEPNLKELHEIQMQLDKYYFDNVSAKDLLRYCKLAIEARELTKFYFSKCVSDLIETLAIWGGRHRISREQISNVTLMDILQTLGKNNSDYIGVDIFNRTTLNMSTNSNASNIKLSHVIRDASDLYVVPLHRSKPNFISSKYVEGTPKLITEKSLVAGSLQGVVVCIRSADPGYDWIFTHPISGLITQYGGANSHMAIRCAELGIPAAIGCGEILFDQMVNASSIAIDCKNNTLLKLDEI